MAVYFFGTETDAISCAAVSTNTAYFDTNYSRSALAVTPTSVATVSISEVGGSDADGWWITGRFRFGEFNASTLGYIFQVLTETGDIAFRHYATSMYGPNSIEVRNTSGSTGTTVLSNLPVNTSYTLTVHCYTAGGYAIAKVYRDRALIGSVSVAGSNRGLATLYIGSPNSGSGTHVSEVIIADEPTFGLRVKTIPPTANGTNTDWSGSYADIDEASPDGVSVLSTAADEVSTYTHSTTLGSGTPYAAVGVGMLAAAGDGAGLQGVLRVGSTDYASSTVDPTLGYTPQFVQWTANPAGGGWHGDTINALEFGVKSVAL